jgi:ABC-type Fe3+/spermidine/putrescine transport system ATPase subunit
MLKVEGLSFKYAKMYVLHDINLSLKIGEHLSIIGESGSGKSTLIKLIYGEYDLNEGHIFWNDTEVFGPKFNLVVGYEFMKYVAQEFDLMPFISVEENIGKHLSNFFPKEKKERIQELLEVVELNEFSKSKVKTLSGGQKQRVALARALAKHPEIILLDEPFSHIDNFKKQSLRRNLFNYLKEKNITCIVATHDKEDVMGYADKMIVLHDGKIMTEASPKQLYHNPKKPLIASFFGEYNVINDELCYSNQLKVVGHSKMEVVVTRSYFKGSYFLIEAMFNSSSIFFEHHESLQKDQSVFLQMSKR